MFSWDEPQFWQRRTRFKVERQSGFSSVSVCRVIELNSGKMRWEDLTPTAVSEDDEVSISGQEEEWFCESLCMLQNTEHDSLQFTFYHIRNILRKLPFRICLKDPADNVFLPTVWRYRSRRSTVYFPVFVSWRRDSTTGRNLSSCIDGELSPGVTHEYDRLPQLWRNENATGAAPILILKM